MLNSSQTWFEKVDNQVCILKADNAKIYATEVSKEITVATSEAHPLCFVQTHILLVMNTQSSSLLLGVSLAFYTPLPPRSLPRGARSFQSLQVCRTSVWKWRGEWIAPTPITVALEARETVTQHLSASPEWKALHTHRIDFSSWADQGDLTCIRHIKPFDLW